MFLGHPFAQPLGLMKDKGDAAGIPVCGTDEKPSRDEVLHSRANNAIVACWLHRPANRLCLAPVNAWDQRPFSR